MRLKQQQRGATLFSIAFYLLLLGFAVFVTLKLFPVYMEAFSVKSSVESLRSEAGVEYTGARSVQQAVQRRFSLNNITAVTTEDIIVVREDQTYKVSVDYQVQVPFISNIDLLVSFSYGAEVPAR